VWSDGAHITRQRLRDILRKEPNPLHRGKTQLASSSQSALAGDAGIAGPHMRNLAVSANPVSDRCRFHRCAAKRPVGGWVATHASKSSLRTRPHVTAASRISVTVCGLVRTKTHLSRAGRARGAMKTAGRVLNRGFLSQTTPRKWNARHRQQDLTCCYRQARRRHAPGTHTPSCSGLRTGDDDIIGTPKRSSPIERCSCHSCGSAVTENVVMGAVGWRRPTL
jgi:hypothetical protein